MNTNISLKNFSEDLQLAVKAATEAGKKLLNLYESKYKLSVKNDNTFITDADLESEKIILDLLVKTQYPILSEETRQDLSRLTSKKVWIIDPLDGTNDFINKTGDFVIMIGLLSNKEPYSGVVYRPTADELYLAEKGFGAFKVVDNAWQKLSVSSGRRAIVSNNPLNEKEKKLLKLCSEVKRRGSIGLKSILISEGYADVFFNNSNRPKQWDTCAAQIIIEEAGGNVSDLFGNRLQYEEQINHPNGILMTNGKIHNLILKGFKNISGE